jgi:hypothetical protein
MAEQQTHFSVSLVLGLVYALMGLLVFDVDPELVVLASVIISVTGILPDVDSGKGPPAREFGSLLAAVSPLLLFDFFPELRVGGVARVVLVVVCCYLLTRIIITRALQKFTHHRGIIHSIPAAMITAELTYLLFWDVFWYDRLYLACSALIGYLSHLVLDAYTNLDFVGKTMGNASRKAPALKWRGDTMGSTLVLYGCMFFFGYFVAVDFYPGISRYVPF